MRLPAATTFCFAATDNGTPEKIRYPFGDEVRYGLKALPKDGGTHTPLIVNCPGIVPAGVRHDMVDFSDFLPTIADIAGAVLPSVILDGHSFWPQCRGEHGTPRSWIFQYYCARQARHHSEWGGGQFIWTQNRHFKLYSSGEMYATSDRAERARLEPGTNATEDAARAVLQAALDSMPARPAYECVIP